MRVEIRQMLSAECQFRGLAIPAQTPGFATDYTLTGKVARFAYPSSENDMPRLTEAPIAYDV